jgi:hypothetical protein
MVYFLMPFALKNCLHYEKDYTGLSNHECIMAI